MNELIFVLAAMNGALLGIVAYALADLKMARRQIIEKVSEFEAVTKLASDSNSSQANKILQLEDKLVNLEFWRQSIAPNRDQGFKMK